MYRLSTRFKKDIRYIFKYPVPSRFVAVAEVTSFADDIGGTAAAGGSESMNISRCISSIEVSSNKHDAYRLSNAEFSSYWQSDGAARSHYIR